LPPSTSSVSGPRSYPERETDQDRWILERRGPRNAVDGSRAVAAFVEEERTERGDIVPVATLLLANRECPWRCLMCDLWKNTTEESVSPGAIPAQIRNALANLPPARRIKLYNSGSFFDPRAVPPKDYREIASLLAGFDRVIVESHPALVGDACSRFRDLVGSADLEVAMGLETAHPEVLAKLNKRMTVEDFRRAARRLEAFGIALRVFVLLGLPFLSREESLVWARRAIDVAFDSGATAVSIVPTRAGNGALDALQESGEFESPTLQGLEAALAYGIGLGRGRVFGDLWDVERLRICGACFRDRVERLRQINRSQALPPPLACGPCESKT
jgi:radical SAM enzyme (TIGR01210 family)